LPFENIRIDGDIFLHWTTGTLPRSKNITGLFAQIRKFWAE